MAMGQRFDVCNGDADGLCAVLCAVLFAVMQGRLAGPCLLNRKGGSA